MPKKTPAEAKHECRGLQDLLSEELAGLAFARTEVTFLLGSDEFIRHERRVAMNPGHVARLRRDLEAAGLRPRIYAVAGAGERVADDFGPAFEDSDYRAAGARIVSSEETAALTGLDVVHALKEPTEYESRLPGAFIRIGALHLASKPPGLCSMLKRKNFTAILDGGTVGSCSFLKYGGDRTPIVGSMSRFAGAVAGRKLVEAVQKSGLGAGRVIVVGGGIAGLAAIRKIDPATAELVVVEPSAGARERLERVLPRIGFEHRFRIVEGFSGELLDGAVGIIFAHRSGARAAEKICHYDDIRRMKRGALIADIAIDQGGSIAHDGYREEDDAAASRAKYRRLVGDEYTYYAETNMPREEPHLASETHGDASLPYVTALLALCARHGSPEAATREILSKRIRSFDSPEEVADRDLLDCVSQDLRNGLQLAMAGGRLEITDPDIERDANLADWVRGCAG
ncbi:MAG: hypothetical protein V3T72_01875 [Thermoanaerobaculia bacterium]